MSEVWGVSLHVEALHVCGDNILVVKESSLFFRSSISTRFLLLNEKKTIFTSHGFSTYFILYYSSI